jgi:HSP20 family protein
MRKEMTRPADGRETNEAPRYTPALDIHEDEDKYTVWCDLPGVEPQDIDVRCEKGRLRIWGKAGARQDEKTAYLLREYGVGDYLRELNVTDTIDVERITAGAADGVLVVTLPKASAAKPRKIDVRAG